MEKKRMKGKREKKTVTREGKQHVKKENNNR